MAIFFQHLNDRHKAASIEVALSTNSQRSMRLGKQVLSSIFFAGLMTAVVSGVEGVDWHTAYMQATLLFLLKIDLLMAITIYLRGKGLVRRLP